MAIHSEAGPKAAEAEGKAVLPTIRVRVLLAAIVVAVCLAVRLPYLPTSTRPTPDGAEYLDIARHLAAGRGAVLSIKPQLFDHRPVVRSTLGDRAVLYPAVVAAGLRLFGPSRELMIGRATNLVFAGLACLLCLLLFASIFGWTVGFGAALLVAANPWHAATSVEPLSDELYLLLLLAALWLFVTRETRPRTYLLSGALTGLAQLARPTAALLLATLLGSAVRARRRWALGWLVLGCGLVLLPYCYGNWRANGSPFYSTFRNNFSVADYREGTWRGLDRKPVTPVEFVRRHSALVAHLIKEKTRWNLRLVGSQLGPLLLLVVLLPVGWWRGPRALLLTTAALNLALYSLAWVPVGATRYLMPTYLLLLPFLLEGALRPRWPWLRWAAPGLFAGALALTLASYLPQHQWIYQRRVKDERGWARQDPTWQRATEWLHHSLPPEAVVSTNQPWQLNYRSHQPTVLCPLFSRDEQVAPFLREHAVAAVVLFTVGGDARLPRLVKDPRVRLALREPVGKKWLLIYRVGGATSR